MVSSDHQHCRSWYVASRVVQDPADASLGLSVPLGKLGYRMPRTISQALSFDKEQSRDALQLKTISDPQSYLRRRRVEPREDQPSPPTFALSNGNPERQDGTPAHNTARESSADSRTLKSV